ncbi:MULTISPECIES: nitrogen regulation protein NR(II) [unclassified Achromobacter]|uniref:two-component system sensor histidine kinase NtrB n=1 Tax=unclassified Achromobacter TaxID=2626865 RepID=UPI000B51A98C|nr:MULTISPECIES: ATP-binding protein [unclassified Achromobacter]OWT75528.1 PAS domain-containing sensor histidine kinase [Achromobacter sp. HZ28]OWT76189.1 PAS domain-containing sensor histidine kinase [Achromobacter sp. HZ34]
MLPADNAVARSPSAPRHSAPKGYKRWHGHMLGAQPFTGPVLQDDTQLHAILELLPHAAILMHRSGFIRFANSAAAALFGYGKDAMIGTAIDTLIPSQAGGPPSRRRMSRVARLQAPAPGCGSDALARRKDGSEFPASVTAKRLQSDGAAETLITIADRTEHAELKDNRSAIAHLTRVSTLGQLAGSLAHELNQPLTAILSNTQAAQRLLATAPLDIAELREILIDLVKDNHRASEVLRKVRLLVKQGEPERAPLRLAGVIEDVAALLHSDAIFRGVRLSLHIAADLPPVAGDKIQLQQVVLNLVLNAFDAVATRSAPDRAVAIEATLDGASMIRVAVRDRGCGFAGDALDSLFKPYFTSKREGLGLGLCISRSIVEMHGGRIWAERNQERGAAILFTVPAMTNPRCAA